MNSILSQGFFVTVYITVASLHIHKLFLRNKSNWTGRKNRIHKLHRRLYHFEKKYHTPFCINNHLNINYRGETIFFLTKTKCASDTSDTSPDICKRHLFQSASQIPATKIEKKGSLVPRAKNKKAWAHEGLRVIQPSGDKYYRSIQCLGVVIRVRI